MDQVGWNNIEPDKYYPHELQRKFYDELSKKVGPNVLVEIGKNLAMNLPLPPVITTFQQQIETLHVGFHMNFKNGPENAYRSTKINENTYKVEVNFDQPTHLNLGLLKGFAQRFDSPAIIEIVDPANGGTFLIQL
ncbi:hypothetical protein [Paenibacillus sp.]|uniref:hypothetical protein n=1 Tax=Paenibacillus sp. TaxID=58172 RepID=UPI002D5FF16A|nr:hypothetical protein [Paenibacillus sp.]HZG57237.1 hypothetical protein [Paenibacillus sp.]